MSVEGVDGIFCVKGNACAANINGTCPEPAEGLEFGAYCDKVKTGVFGCKPKAAPKTASSSKKKSVHKHKQAPKCGKDESPMSVEGVEGVFCVKGDACVADIDGECPTPQKGLEFGAYCDEVKTGVMGCKPYKSWEDWLKDHPEDNEESEEVDDDECDDDETEMSVEGVEGIFCVAGQACVANTNGTCPEPQDGLEFGAYCGKVKSGVLGCKPYKSEAGAQGGSAEDEAAHQVCEGSHEEGWLKAHARRCSRSTTTRRTKCGLGIALHDGHVYVQRTKCRVNCIS
ncbi:hypothetical protein PINS_up023324 [Pythium insidiosum]|nr:hypothetical protein PINS_up023324 [Pythium insidiosum]